MSRVGGVVASSLRIDIDNLTPVSGAVRALPVLICVIVGLAIGGSRVAISMAIGANLIALLSLFSRARLPLTVAVVDTFGIGATAFLGAVTGSIAWLHLLTLVIVCFIAGMLVVIGPSQTTGGVQAIIAFLVLGRFHEQPRGALELSLLVMLGATIEIVALAVLRLPPSLRVQRLSLADALDALSEIPGRDPTRSHFDLTTTIDRAEQTLRSHSLFGRSDAQDLRAILDQIKRLRRQLTAITGLRTRLAEAPGAQTTPPIDECLSAATLALEALASALRQGDTSGSWKSATRTFDLAVAQFAERGTSSVLDDDPEDVLLQQCGVFLAALGGQLRAIGSLLMSDGSVPLPRTTAAAQPSSRRPLWDAVLDDLDALRSNLTLESPALRHAIRLSVAVPLAALLAEWASVPRAYWVPYAVAVILKPDYSTLLTRGVARAIGVLLGATLAAALVGTLHPDLALTTALIGLTAWAAYTVWGASFAWAIGLDTSFLLLLFSTTGINTPGTAVDRFLDIAAGGLIALVAYLIWPSLPRAGVSDALSDLFDRLSDFLSIVLSMLEDGAAVEASIVRLRARASRQALSRAEDAVGRAIAEPRSNETDEEMDRGLLVVALRVVRVTHALRIEAELGTTIPTSSALQALVDGLLDGLIEIARALREGREALVGDLRLQCIAVQATLGVSEQDDALRLHLDELVNATNTAAFLTQRALESAE